MRTARPATANKVPAAPWRRKSCTPQATTGQAYMPAFPTGDISDSELMLIRDYVNSL